LTVDALNAVDGSIPLVDPAVYAAFRAQRRLHVETFAHVVDAMSGKRYAELDALFAAAREELMFASGGGERGSRKVAALATTFVTSPPSGASRERPRIRPAQPKPGDLLCAALERSDPRGRAVALVHQFGAQRYLTLRALSELLEVMFTSRARRSRP
jgi:hypothetical protein